MTLRFRRLWLALGLLLVLLAIEFGVSFLPLGRDARPLVMVPGRVYGGNRGRDLHGGRPWPGHFAPLRGCRLAVAHDSACVG